MQNNNYMIQESIMSHDTTTANKETFKKVISRFHKELVNKNRTEGLKSSVNYHTTKLSEYAD